MERICSYGSKFIPLGADPIDEGLNNENGIASFPQSVPIHPDYSNCLTI